jgi:hypothetical protein
VADRKPRTSSKVKLAVEQMVLHGKSRSDAAAIARLQDDSLYRALLRPEVIGYRNQLLEVIRTSAASRTIFRAEHLADNADSEHVRNDANQWIASLDRETTPISRSEVAHTGVTLGPGLVIVMGPLPALPPVIEGTSIEIPPEYRHLPEPVPHPSMVRRQAERLSAQHEPEDQD